MYIYKYLFICRNICRYMLCMMDDNVRSGKSAANWDEHPPKCRSCLTLTGATPMIRTATSS